MLLPANNSNRHGHRHRQAWAVLIMIVFPMALSSCCYAAATSSNSGGVATGLTATDLPVQQQSAQVQMPQGSGDQTAAGQDYHQGQLSNQVQLRSQQPSQAQQQVAQDGSPGGTAAQQQQQQQPPWQATVRVNKRQPPGSQQQLSSSQSANSQAPGAGALLGCLATMMSACAKPTSQPVFKLANWQKLSQQPKMRLQCITSPHD